MRDKGKLLPDDMWRDVYMQAVTATGEKLSVYTGWGFVAKKKRGAVKILTVLQVKGMSVDRIWGLNPFSMKCCECRRRFRCVACNSLLWVIPPRCVSLGGPRFSLKCKVKLIYIIFSLIASPDVRKSVMWLTGCSINYWHSNILHVLLGDGW